MAKMVVGWQYIPMPVKGYTIGPYPNGIRLEGSQCQNGTTLTKMECYKSLLVWQELELKYSLTVGKKHGEGREGPGSS